MQYKCKLIYFFYIKNLHTFVNKVTTSAESSPSKETGKRKKGDSTAVSRKLSDLMDRLVSTVEHSIAWIMLLSIKI